MKEHSPTELNSYQDHSVIREKDWIKQTRAMHAGLIGLIAGFWHIYTLAGIATMIAVLVGCITYSIGYTKLLRQRRNTNGDRLGN